MIGAVSRVHTRGYVGDVLRLAARDDTTAGIGLLKVCWHSAWF